ncbi:sulfate/molybdate ABC transporter ATP-binding protein [Cyanobacterium sp. IPPAS B-1200]|uniref:sulfate/molybdate ABC transporter ATP-binding protein n=1 Tax=Cyanobacterium sp. IPPAS B-1200 TaxID=1562720 RepID=UPI00085256C1|nr:sulfate ABC transporter ATP-binding protein [Cyanobacterium sp. IPPAS B-1200]OEJ78595.1 sulfate ABC transporter ATP-binding protein [Cyanobacterium sp. IPPAS B-1200]
MSIIINQVNKKFGDFQALKDINLEVKPNTLVALLGPSGSGKSTLLRVIAGLENPDNGQVIINGKDTTNLDIRKRNIGFVFQHYALFKHLTIRENIAFGLRIRKTPKNQVKHKVAELLDLIQLEGLGDRYPSQLSGGQRQRVALARALAVQPQVLLLDEPFGALDAKVRKDLRAWLRRLHDEVHITSVFVTHDQEEAMEVADEIVVMNHGVIEQIGTPAEIYDYPASPFVMKFIGEVNILPSHTPLFVNVNHDEYSSHPEVFVRPHEVDILLTDDDKESTKTTIKRITHLGAEVQIELSLENNLPIIAHVTRQQFISLNLKKDQVVFIKPHRIKTFA